MNKSLIIKLSILTILFSLFTLTPIWAENKENTVVSEQKSDAETSKTTEIKPEQETITLDFTDHGKLDLDKSIDIALKYNRDLLKQFEDNNIYHLQVFQNITQYFPTLNASYDFKLNTIVREVTMNLPGSPESISFKTNQRTEGTTTVKASQPVTDLY
ncbi:MAG: hypothetical protein AB7V50_07765, partial [Vampirovibrionia bacterium]